MNKYDTYREDFKNKLKTRIKQIEKLEHLAIELDDMISIYSNLQSDVVDKLDEKIRLSYNRETLVSTNELLGFFETLKENRENEITELYKELLTLKASQL